MFPRSISTKRLRLESLEIRCNLSAIDPFAGALVSPERDNDAAAVGAGLDVLIANTGYDRDAALAVIDSGIDYTHPDLYLNISLNQQEIPAAAAPGGHVKASGTQTATGRIAGITVDTSDPAMLSVADDDVVVIVGPGGAPGGHVEVFDGRTGGELSSQVELLSAESADLAAPDEPADGGTLIPVKVKHNV